MEATDRRFRDNTVGQTLLNSLEARLANGHVTAEENDTANVTPLGNNLEANKLTILDHVDRSQSLSDKQYNRELKYWQARLYDAAWKAHEARKSVVTVFEGWDASGVSHAHLMPGVTR